MILHANEITFAGRGEPLYGRVDARSLSPGDRTKSSNRRGRPLDLPARRLFCNDPPKTQRSNRQGAKAPRNSGAWRLGALAVHLSLGTWRPIVIFSARDTEISLGRGARFPRSPFRRRRTFRALPRRDRPAPAPGPVPDRTARREPCHGVVARGQPLLLVRSSAGSGGPLATADQLGDCLSEAFERQ